MLPWPCGLLLETPHRYLLLHSPLPPCLPSLPPSTTLSSTCCASPTFASVSTKTRLCYERGSTGEVRSQIRKNILDPLHSAIRTWASPRAFQMDSRRAMGVAWTALTMQHCVMGPCPNGLPASWPDPATARSQLASSHLNHRLTSSNGTISFFHEENNTGQVPKRTERLLSMDKSTNGLHTL